MIDFLQGDVFDNIKKLDDNSIDCVVTSPPYWGLRDYGVIGQLGLEPTYQEHIQNIVKLFRDMKPKLKDSATIWLNYGDSYASTVNGTKVKDQVKNKVQFAGKYLIEGDDRTFRDKPFSTIQGSLKPKDLVMIPNRIAIALQDDGWWIRSEIIWHKPNPMPESTKDRPTSCHEKIWLITKSKKYYYDADAIREPLVSSSINVKIKSNGNIKNVFGKYKTDENEKKHRQGMSKTRGSKLVETRPKLPSQKEFVKYLREKTTLKYLVENTDIKKTTIEHWFRNDEVGFAFPSVEDWNKIKDLLNDWTEKFNNLDYALTYVETHLDKIQNNPLGKNKRNVWTITTKPCKEAHFATFPKDLVEPCIKAGCPENGIVFDPFGGSGTTGIVAKLLNRKAILSELNPEYIKIAKIRINKEFGMF